jgi:hypothetical protein
MWSSSRWVARAGMRLYSRTFVHFGTGNVIHDEWRDVVPNLVVVLIVISIFFLSSTHTFQSLLVKRMTICPYSLGCQSPLRTCSWIAKDILWTPPPGNNFQLQAPIYNPTCHSSYSLRLQANAIIIVATKFSAHRDSQTYKFKDMVLTIDPISMKNQRISTVTLLYQGPLLRF